MRASSSLIALSAKMHCRSHRAGYFLTPKKIQHLYFSKMVFSEFRSIFATPELSFLIGKVFFDPKTMFLKPQRKRERERDNGGDGRRCEGLAGHT